MGEDAAVNFLGGDEAPDRVPEAYGDLVSALSAADELPRPSAFAAIEKQARTEENVGSER